MALDNGFLLGGSGAWWRAPRVVVVVNGKPEVGIKTPISPQWSNGSLSDLQA